MSNGDVYEKTHDELDFEFLGNIKRREWRVQTNVYGNGSTLIRREERYSLWFDPTEDFFIGMPSSGAITGLYSTLMKLQSGRS